MATPIVRFSLHKISIIYVFNAMKQQTLSQVANWTGRSWAPSTLRADALVVCTRVQCEQPFSQAWPTSDGPLSLKLSLESILNTGTNINIILTCKEAYSSLCYKHHTATGTHVPHGITQCVCYSLCHKSLFKQALNCQLRLQPRDVADYSYCSVRARMHRII